MRGDRQWPVCITHCCDCGAGTITLGEWYMVNPDLWKRAWAGRRKPHHGKLPGQEILCIGCLEHRIGRMLCRADFPEAPVNDPNEYWQSKRLRDRLARRELRP